MIYEFVWRAVCGLLGAVGVALACIALPAEVMVSIVVLAAVVGATTVVGHMSTAPEGEPPSGRGRSAVLGVLAGAAVVAVAGLAVIVGAGVIGLLLVLGVCSPQALRWYGVRLRVGPAVEADRPEVSTAELCRQWQDTYDTLRSAATLAARLRIVEARQRCLDELERRDPAGLNAWLASNASAAGDPSRFLAGSGPEQPPTDN